MDTDPVGIFLAEIAAEYASGQAREHAYRPALKKLFESSVSSLRAINDPKHSEHGAPDFALMRSRELSAGYVEAKDVTVSLDETEKSEQMKRYLEYGSLVLTNCLEFRFYRHGVKYGDSIVVATISDGRIVPTGKNVVELADTIRTFLTEAEPIKSSRKLAQIMGDKARRIRDKVAEYVKNEHERNDELREMFESFRQILVHDLSEEQFADMYAQTLVYGLFAARYEDKTVKDFTRSEARDLLPKSNPFLRKFFDHITGNSFDVRLSVITNELCEIFQYSNVHDLLNEYVTQKGLLDNDLETSDPVIHFYEDFLKEYDPEKRKKVGAFYTPLPVVRFIVRAIDDVLKKEFGLAGGIADTSKIAISETHFGKTKKVDVHRVQILDPATGTGTFLNEIIKYVRKTFEGQEGKWPSYVHDHLIPRLHGFELMMAPYTIAHLKLGMTLHDSGIKNLNQRLGVYLTNSLEEGAKIEGTLFGIGFGREITAESQAAAHIKNNTPVMVVIGNPPYSVSSSNKGEWIQELIKEYKKDLGERKINLDDDYIKFIRLAEYFIEKNKTGIVSMITNNSFIDGITHRQMRKKLLETFNEIYIFDLHGNSKKKEKSPDGNKDENVFQIQQGVSINIFVRNNEKKKDLGDVYHAELFGKRENKLEALEKSEISTVLWNKLDSLAPNYFFVPKNFGSKEKYDKGFKIDELFSIYTSGVETQKDSLVVRFTKPELDEVRNDLESMNNEEIFSKYGIADSRDWNLDNARKDIEKALDVQISYRPFDARYSFYSGKTKGIVAYPRREVAEHFKKNNLGLLTVKRLTSFDKWHHVFLSNSMAERCSVSLQTGEVGYVFPLYLYPEEGENFLAGEAGNILVSRIPNIDTTIARNIAEKVGFVWYPTAECKFNEGDTRLDPESIFDYIYAVLHSPNYLEKYKEFLKIDFPRVPYPKNAESFRKLVELGRELRGLHLLESPKVNEKMTSFPESGSDMVEVKYPKYENGKVFINETQYFGGVPDAAWNFYIGGYQPAQKWLKDRRSRKLLSDEITHYQKVIVALSETDRIVGIINAIDLE
jgi:predicted helicase